jgi:hypothetical protein
LFFFYKRGIPLANHEKEAIRKNLKLSESKPDFPGWVDILKYWPIVTLMIIFIAFFNFLFPYLASHFPDLILLKDYSELLQGVGPAICVFVFFIVSIILLKKRREDWALNKIQNYIKNPSSESPIFELLNDIFYTGFFSGEYIINSKRPKEEKYILNTIINIFYSIGFWEDY